MTELLVKGSWERGGWRERQVRTGSGGWGGGDGEVVGVGGRDSLGRDEGGGGVVRRRGSLGEEDK